MDGWTADECNKSFWGVTAHWIDEKFHLHHLVLDFVDVTDVHHTGEGLANVMWLVLEKRGILKKVSNPRPNT